MAVNKKQQKRTYARNRSKSSEFFSRKGSEKVHEKDGIFFGKLVLFILLSTLWVRFENPLSAGLLSIHALPVGLMIALLIVLKIEKYQFNRKIWYTALILMAILTSFTPVGILL